MSDYFSGKKQLNVVRSHINGLFASLFNIIAHLQGPLVFYSKPNGIAVNKNPDSGSVVLMCVEVLTRISGKRAQFHLDSHHVGQSLHIPAAVFQGFCLIGVGKDSRQSSIRSDGKEYEKLESYFLVDSQFSVNLYAASCRLLWTVVKHRKRYIFLIVLVFKFNSTVPFSFLVLIVFLLSATIYVCLTNHVVNF